jgi:competence protein ComEC
MMRDVLLIPALGLAAGVAASRWLDLPPLDAAIAFCALVAISWFSLRRGYSTAAAIGVACAAWCVGIGVEHHHRRGPAPEIEFASGETMTLEGCVVESPLLFPGRERFVLELEPGARVLVSLFLKEDENPPDLHYGQLVELDARLRKPHNYRNPGAFDFVSYLARRDVHWTASANGSQRIRVKGSCGNPYLAVLLRARESALEKLDRVYGGDLHSSGMLRAVLLGDVSKLEQVWVEDFRRTGTYHALVISGLHVTTLAACFVFCLRVLSLGPLWPLLLTSALGWVYAAAVGFNAPVVRAAAGLTLYQLCACLYRRPRVLNLLSAVAIGFLLFDPEQLFEASFQLTFLAVAMIGAVAAPWLDQTAAPYGRGARAISNLAWDRHLEPRTASYRVEMRLLAETLRRALRIPEKVSLACLGLSSRLVLFFWSLFVVSAIVQAGLALPMVTHFHRFSLSGLTANLLIVPLMNLAVPLGFLTIATGWQWCAWICGALLRWSSAIAAWHAVREPSWRVPDPPPWLAALFLLALIWTAGGMISRKRTPVLALAVLLAAIVVHPFRPAVARQSLEMTVIDVGQGDSILLTAPDGRTMIVDTGGFPVFRGQRRTTWFDIGEDVVSAYLFTRSIKRVDVIALSHAHEDHIGGVKALVENFRPREIWTGAFADLDRIRALGVPVRSPRGGERIEWGGASIDVVSPPPGYEPKEARNNDSLAFRIAYGERSFLLTGDIEKAMEYRMIDDRRLARADVLKVAHHGSRTSTVSGFLEEVKPVHAVISDGIDNLFRHPHPEVLQRLSDFGVAVWRTDRHGLVTFRTDGRRVEVDPFVR